MATYRDLTGALQGQKTSDLDALPTSSIDAATLIRLAQPADVDYKVTAEDFKEWAAGQVVANMITERTAPLTGNRDVVTSDQGKIIMMDGHELNIMGLQLDDANMNLGTRFAVEGPGLVLRDSEILRLSTDEVIQVEVVLDNGSPSSAITGHYSTLRKSDILQKTGSTAQTVNPVTTFVTGLTSIEPVNIPSAVSDGQGVNLGQVGQIINKYRTPILDLYAGDCTGTTWPARNGPMVANSAGTTPIVERGDDGPLVYLDGSSNYDTGRRYDWMHQSGARWAVLVEGADMLSSAESGLRQLIGTNASASGAVGWTISRNSGGGSVIANITFGTGSNYVALASITPTTGTIQRAYLSWDGAILTLKIQHSNGTIYTATGAKGNTESVATSTRVLWIARNNSVSTECRLRRIRIWDQSLTWAELSPWMT